MERQFIALRTVGKTDQILDRIRKAVQTLKLTRVVPVVKVEKKPRGEFYVFLAMEDESQIQSIDKALKIAGLKGEKLWPIGQSEIKAMTGNTEIETSRFDSLAYYSTWLRYLEETEEYGNLPSLEELESPEIDSDDCDRLLYWLSYNGTGTWRNFVSVCQVLKIAENPFTARQIFRNLYLLGHLESLADSSKWFIRPPTIMPDFITPTFYFLCGYRTPRLVQHVKENTVTCTEINKNGPKLLGFSGNKNEVGQLLSQNWQYAELDFTLLHDRLPSIDEYVHQLHILDPKKLNGYSLEFWKGTSYLELDEILDVNEMRYRSGLYRLSRDFGQHSHRMSVYWEASQQKWYQGDWHDLKFLAKKNEGLKHVTKHDPLTGRLYIPLSYRWPSLYERILVLCSGHLPQVDKNKNWLCYTSVPEEIVELLTVKLGESTNDLS